MKFATKSELIYNILKSQIVNGVLTQGKAINISELAKKNEMSTIPVRESLKRLEAEGFVKIIPYKGAIVTSYDEEKIIEVMLIRGVLEGFIAKTVLGNITEYQIKELKKINNFMSECANSGSDGKFVELNQLFHATLYSYSSNKLLKQMINSLWEKGNWSKTLFAYYPKCMNDAVKEHNRIIEMIERKDSEKLEKLVRIHKENRIELYLKIASGQIKGEKNENI